MLCLLVYHQPAGDPPSPSSYTAACLCNQTSLEIWNHRLETTITYLKMEKSCSEMCPLLSKSLAGWDSSLRHWFPTNLGPYGSLELPSAVYLLLVHLQNPFLGYP
jgi:hypothetical protein